MTADERALCAATAGALRASAAVASLGWLLTAVALVGLLLAPSTTGLAAGLFGVVALAGLVERVGAYRLRLDRGLFESLSTGQIATLAALDSALQALGLRTAGRDTRGLAHRIAGTRRLVVGHMLVVIFQSAAVALAALRL